MNTNARYALRCQKYECGRPPRHYLTWENEHNPDGYKVVVCDEHKENFIKVIRMFPSLYKNVKFSCIKKFQGD